MALKTQLVRFDTVHSAYIINIRTQVFVEEQKIASEIDFDGQDKNAVHTLVYYDNVPVGTARMLSDGHIGRVAVLKEWRGIGAGISAVTTLIEEAERSGLERVYLGSQIQAAGFYQRLGFNQVGAIFMEAGIEHIHMELQLINSY